MTEEQVTKSLLQYLTDNGWHIVCFDFPQSGTGTVLHPNNAGGEKNKDTIIPDIVAVKNNIALFFENKDRFYLPDYKKINELIENNQFTHAIDNLLSHYIIKNIYYGIGLPTEKHKQKSKESVNLVDFIVGVKEEKQIEILYNPKGIPI
jgi:hypothetical protein